MKWKVAVFFLCLACAGGLAQGQGTQPVVAIHDSEFTRALETMPASGATPNGTGTTSNQWWITEWHYFVMPDSVKEALRSDGTAFTVIGDSNIMAGILTNADGSPKYPILISLGAEAMDDSEIFQLTNYVASGGFLFVGSSSFTRNTNGTTRGNFALANAMGVNMINPGLTNWYFDDTFSKMANHPLLSILPLEQVQWQMPQSSEEISWPAYTRFTGEDPDASQPGLPHMIWQVQANGATVIAQGDDNLAYILVEPYGKGYFIYDAALQPLLGHGGWAPGMYAYSIFRNAIQWAFQTAGLPVVRCSPWPYPYDAAVMFRHDMEAIPTNIISIEKSAQYEHANLASGDYYFCTGTLRLDMPKPTLTNTIASLQRAINNDGATINSHNGGLTNINPYYRSIGYPLVVIEANLNQLLSEGWLTALEPYTAPTLAPFPSDGLEYDYWHWGPDEILDLTNGSAYSLTSISNSFVDLAGWGLTNATPRAWVAPYFNATREGSFQIEQQLGIKITGDTKISPFPHWTLSTQTPDKLYPTLQLPVSDWFVDYQGLVQIAQAMEAGHTTATVQALVDAYYNLGALINLYCHSESPSGGPAGSLPGTYLTYSLSKPRIWSTNSAGIYAWWLQRSNAQVTASFSASGGMSTATLSISGNSSTNAAVELLMPSSIYSALQVFTNGIEAGTNTYRTNGLTIKFQVGTWVSNLVVSYLLPPVVNDNFYQMTQGNTLAVPAPGILTNGTGAAAALASGPANGTLVFSTNGSFTYTPTNNYTGMDSFTYTAINGSLTSAVATASIMITTPAQLFYDNFARAAGSHSIFPWVNQMGSWSITNELLQGSCALDNYGYAYYSANWTDYSVQARIRYPSTNVWGGAIGGRLNPATGAHYDVWILPENSPWGPQNGVPSGVPTLQILKYRDWFDYAAENLVRLPAVGTNWHNVKVAFLGSNVFAYFDGNLITNLVDNGTFDGQPALMNGGITAEVYAASPTAYTMSFSNFIVAPLVLNPSYSTKENTVLTVPKPGVLTNDLDVYGTNLIATLLSGPTNGTLNLSTNGGFTYTPATNFSGNDGFVFRLNDKLNVLGVATATITVTPLPTLTVTADTQARIYGTTNPILTVSYTGFTNNDGTNVLTGAPALSTSADVTSPIGNYTITVNQGTLNSTNYGFQFVNGMLTVNPAVLTLTAGSTNKTYGQTVLFKGTEFTSSDLVNGDTVTNVNLSSSGAGATASVANSPYAINASNATGAGLTNHTIQYQPGTLIVNRAPLAVTADNQTRAYGATNPVLTVSYSGFVNGEGTNVISGAPVLTTSATTNSPVGGYVITNSLGNLVATNYAVSLANGTLTVTGAVLTATANNLSRLYGATNPVLTVSYSGFVNGEGTNVISGAPVLTTSAMTNSPVGGYTITNSLGNLVATNYAVSLANGTLTVTGAVLAATADNQTRAYGATNPVLTVSYSGFVNGEGTNVISGAPVLTTSATTNSPVGGYVITNSLGNLVATNYAVSLTNGTLTVTGAVLAVKADDQTRMYSLTNPQLTASYVGFVNSDNTNVLQGSPVLGTSANPSSPVGNYPITIAQGTLSADNYSFVFNSGTLTVTSAPVPVILSFELTNQVIGVTWSSVAGALYGLQYSSNLTDTGWNDISPAVTATGPTTSQTNNLGTGSQQFYRVKLQPATP
jgi:hypothetical protein